MDPQGQCDVIRGCSAHDPYGYTRVHVNESQSARATATQLVVRAPRDAGLQRMPMLA